MNILFLALVLLNLLSLWVDSGNNRRIILLSLSLYGHFMYMQQLFFSLPHNGDTVPDLCKRLTNWNVIYLTSNIIIKSMYKLSLCNCDTNTFFYVFQPSFLLL